jgi:hypothetical protein
MGDGDAFGMEQVDGSYVTVSAMRSALVSSSKCGSNGSVKVPGRGTIHMKRVVPRKGGWKVFHGRGRGFLGGKRGLLEVEWFVDLFPC